MIGSTRALEVLFDEEDIDRDCLDDTLELEAVEDEEYSAATLASRLDLRDNEIDVSTTIIHGHFDRLGQCYSRPECSL